MSFSSFCKRELASLGFLRRRVLAHHQEALTLPQGLAVLLIDDLDIHGDLHLALRDIGAADARLERDGDVRVVVHDAPADDRVGVGLRGRAQAEAPLDRIR